MLYPLITIDYEIFGDGSGSVKRDIIEPMESIRKICDEFDYKINIMFEVAEYIKMKEYSKNNPDLLNDVELISQQVKSLHDDGHDIQLHYHPQFAQAIYRNGHWIINDKAFTFEYYEKLLGEHNFKRFVKKLFLEGIREIRRVVQDSNHKIIAFRAGGWSFVPQSPLISVLKQVGIKIDTSAFKGGKTKTKHYNYDYRSIKEDIGYWWTTDTDISVKGNPGENIVEMPIFSRYYPLVGKEKYDLLNIKRKLTMKSQSIGHKKSSIINRFHSLRSSLLSDCKWDFCKLNADYLYDFYKHASKLDSFNETEINPLVMIGHTKDFSNESELRAFFSKLNKTHGEKFHTFNSIFDIIKKGMPH